MGAQTSSLDSGASVWLGFVARLRAALSDPRVLWLVLLLAAAVSLPTLDAGLIGDDLEQQLFVRAKLDGHPAMEDRAWWDMFVLVEHDPRRAVGLRTSGRYPWWVDPDLHIAFFRPVSAATHYLDWMLWPEQVWLMHLHSVAWYLLACLLAGLLARRLCASSTAASLAALCYALCYAHLSPVGWLAYRNGLVATVFGFAALLAHDRW